MSVPGSGVPGLGVRLDQLTTLRVGGPARDCFAPPTEAELVAELTTFDAVKEPVLLVGGGSNLVVADAGFDGTVVRLATRGVHHQRTGDVVQVTADAGEPWDDLVADCVAEGLSGIEALSGIPGLVGATPVQNVGAYGQEIAQTLVSVRVLDRERSDILELTAADCGFGYRTSRFKGSERFLVLAVTLALSTLPAASAVTYPEVARALGVAPGASAPPATVRAAVLDLRRAKGMVLDPTDPDTASAGSFFTNPLLSQDQVAALPAEAPTYPQPDGTVKVSAAWLIEHAGFSRGYSIGAAGLSTKHTLAITNRGGATTEELLVLARTIRDGVRATYGVELVPEPRLVGCSL